MTILLDFDSKVSLELTTYSGCQSLYWIVSLLTRYLPPYLPLFRYLHNDNIWNFNIISLHFDSDKGWLLSKFLIVHAGGGYERDREYGGDRGGGGGYDRRDRKNSDRGGNNDSGRSEPPSGSKATILDWIFGLTL